MSTPRFSLLPTDHLCVLCASVANLLLTPIIPADPGGSPVTPIIPALTRTRGVGGLFSCTLAPTKKSAEVSSDYYHGTYSKNLGAPTFRADTDGLASEEAGLKASATEKI